MLFQAASALQQQLITDDISCSKIFRTLGLRDLFAGTRVPLSPSQKAVAKHRILPQLAHPEKPHRCSEGIVYLNTNFPPLITRYCMTHHSTGNASQPLENSCRQGRNASFFIADAAVKIRTRKEFSPYFIGSNASGGRQ